MAGKCQGTSIDVGALAIRDSAVKSWTGYWASPTALWFALKVGGHLPGGKTAGSTEPLGMATKPFGEPTKSGAA